MTVFPARIAVVPATTPTLGNAVAPEPPRFLSRDAAYDIIQQLLGFTSGCGTTHLTLISSWRGEVRWARNRAAVTGDWRDVHVEINRRLLGGRQGHATTNQLDPAWLRAAVDWAERMLHVFGESQTLDQRFHWTMPPGLPWGTIPYTAPHIWSDRTYAQTAETRSVIAAELTESAERAGMLSAGYLSVEARGSALRLDDGRYLYAPQTVAQCSLTVRDPMGTGSGWAGASSYDWGRFDAHQLADIALDKCLRSRNPVALEPGRYTVIMEPQATFELIEPFIETLDRRFAEGERTSIWFRSKEQVSVNPLELPVNIGISKIGERIFDERITISHDPMDPDLGVIPFDFVGDAYAPVTWVDNGVLAELAYDTGYAQNALHKPRALPNSWSFRMSGGTETIEDMIATMKRGLLVTRFSDIHGLVAPSLLMTGLTRDGLWLIENGKISHPVKNFRWVESPMFVFNNVEQLGVPVPVFSPGRPAVVPPVKVRDFSFTALVDAV